MNWWRALTVAFWVFVIVMLLKQAYDYNNKVTADAKANPEKHYFYNPGGNASATPQKASVPDVRQLSYKVIHDLPQPGSFTVQFTVKNMGTVAATGIQVKIRPYRGIMNGDDDNGNPHNNSDSAAGGGVAPITDNDPVSQIGQWVTVPDLAPGQSSSDSAIFIDQPNMSPNEDNPKLEIIFEPVKSK